MASALCRAPPRRSSGRAPVRHAAHRRGCPDRGSDRSHPRDCAARSGPEVVNPGPAVSVKSRRLGLFRLKDRAFDGAAAHDEAFALARILALAGRRATLASTLAFAGISAIALDGAFRAGCGNDGAGREKRCGGRRNEISLVHRFPLMAVARRRVGLPLVCIRRHPGAGSRRAQIFRYTVP
jgi:hypothetical protein